MKWKLLMKEVLISRLGGKSGIIPKDMSGTVHHEWFPVYEDIELILVYYGAITSHIVDGNICIRGNRLIIDVDIVKGNKKCLVVKVTDSSGDE